MSNSQQLNDRITRGLRAQFSADRTTQIIEQAYATYHYRSPNVKNSPELYELVEGGFVDEALETLGFGAWCIGRPRLGNGSQNKPKLGIFRANGSGRLSVMSSRPSVSASPSGSTPTTEGQKPPLVTDLFQSHIPKPGELRKAYSEWANSIEYRNLLVVGDQSSGKTTLVERLAEDLAEQYKPFAVESWIQTGDWLNY